MRDVKIVIQSARKKKGVRRDGPWVSMHRWRLMWMWLLPSLCPRANPLPRTGAKNRDHIGCDTKAPVFAMSRSSQATGAIDVLWSGELICRGETL